MFALKPAPERSVRRAERPFLRAGDCLLPENRTDASSTVRLGLDEHDRKRHPSSEKTRATRIAILVSRGRSSWWRTPACAGSILDDDTQLEFVAPRSGVDVARGDADGLRRRVPVARRSCR
jgi:hypothetical protein